MNEQDTIARHHSMDEIVWLEEEQLNHDAPLVDSEHLATHEGSRHWQVLIVDDDPDVHTATSLALNDFQFEGRSLKFYSAYNAVEAQAILSQQPDIACILLDVVMESSHAGLNLVRYIREELRNQKIRIVLRTGQPGEAPETSIMLDYDINDYQLKLNLTRQRLITTIILALRSYRDIITIESQRSELAVTLAQLQQTQKQLQDYTQNLESRVAERTAALNSSNLQLQRLAAVDGLTQVPNRRSFDEYLAGQWEHLSQIQQPLALIMLDVDYFKNYNDHYGHRAGDACLKKLAQTIAASIKRPQDLAARYGGEEFAILLPATPAAGATRVTTAVIQAVAELNIPHETSQVIDANNQSQLQRVTFSAGISWMIPQSDIPSSVLIEAADRALYRAKQQGRNCIQVYGQNHTA